MKLSKMFMALVSFALIALAFAQAPRNETVIFDIDGGLVAQPFNFNWMLPGTNRNQGMHQAVWEPLFILNYETGEIEPWLGESFTSNESLDVWTLKLRDGIEWSDGEAYNADDVVFTLNLLLGDETASLGEAANTQQWVESVEKIDDLTVQFNLKAPNPRYQLDFWSVRIWGGTIILPEHVWADQDPFTFQNYDPEKGWPLGTGAYTLTSASENEFVYTRNDNWWGAKVGIPEQGITGLPEPKSLVWVAIANEETRSLLASEGNLDSVMDVTLGAYEAINSRNPNVLSWVNGAPFAWLDPCPRQISFNLADPVWGIRDLRHAVNKIIDRDQVVSIAYEGTTIPSRSLYVEYGGLFPVIEAVVEDGYNFDVAPDLEGAKALIEGQGYALNSDGIYAKDGQTLSLVVQVHEGFTEKRRLTSVVVEQLRQAGIDAVQQNVAGGTWGDNKAFGNYQAVADWDACGSINEPFASLNRYTAQFAVPVGERSPGGNNHVRWSGPDNDRFSELVAEMGSLPLGDPQILPLVREAYALYYDAMPFIPITQAKKLIPFDYTYWTGWPSAENNYNHPATWWMSTHQIIHNLRAAQ